MEHNTVRKVVESVQGKAVTRSLGMLSLVIAGLSCMLPNSAQAQRANAENSAVSLDEPPVDGYFVKTDIQDRKVIDYAPIRSADVSYVKRVWQEFDLRDKINAIYASPKSNLMQIIMEAVLAGELTAYDPTPSAEDPTGDSFKTILPPDQVMARFGGDSTLVEQYDEDGNVISSRFEAAEFNPDQVLRFRIKEDWIFDKQRSVFEPRIVGIAPLITPNLESLSNTGGDFSFDADGNPIQKQSVDVDAYPAFWIYFPEARHIFVNKEVASRDSDVGLVSYDDVFVRRLFSSYIVKESNPKDLRIKDYVSDGVGRLYESERIKKNLINFEEDLWSYE